MASMQYYKPVEKTCNQVNCPPMTNQGQTQCYGQTQTTQSYSLIQPPMTKPCMDQNKGQTFGSGLGLNQTYGMGSTHASHNSNHCMDQNKTHGHSHGHGMTHTHSSNGHGHGMTHTHPSNGHGHGMTHTHSSNGHGHGLTQTHFTSQTCAPNNGTACHGRTKKKNLFQRIKDGISGDSSDSSDSESDDEHCGRTRTVQRC
ncbi:hypothetical protein ACOSQ2_024946 [Xanthoceras sorbifolium]